MRTVLIGLTIVCVCAITLGCDRSPKLPQPSTQSPLSSSEFNTDQEGRIIVAFGDSLTAGLGVTPQESYPAQLEARLNTAGYSYRVVNAGVSGDTTAGGIRRLDWIIKTNPEVVILELGANDGLRGIPLNEVRANLNRMVQSLQDKGIQVILAGMKLPPNYGPLYTRGFSNLYPELAKEYDTPIIPFFLEGVAGRPELNQDDGLHPTAAGYSRVVDNVLPVLLPLLTARPVSDP
ncbi:MAG: arylesterase [Nitrospira sp.]|nr:arylesterase [Nitrospira sp.]